MQRSILLFSWCLPLIGALAEQGETPAYLHAEQRAGQFWLIGNDDKPKVELSASAHALGQTDDDYVSPDRHWLFTTTNYRHRALQERELFAVSSTKELTPFKEGWFSGAVEEYLIRNAVFKRIDIVDEQRYDHLQTDCIGWSIDSGRLLICLSLSESSDDRRFYLYFNTRTKSFEQTSYLRAFNRLIAARHLAPEDTPLDVLCMEPINTLPPLAELAHRLETLDAELNTLYRSQINNSEQDKDYLRNAELDWIQARDEGLKLYLQHFVQSERQQRRLQFLGDATARRIFELTPREDYQE